MYLLAMCHHAAKILLSVGLQVARSFLFLARFLDLVHSAKCKRFTNPDFPPLGSLALEAYSIGII